MEIFWLSIALQKQSILIVYISLFPKASTKLSETDLLTSHTVLFGTTAKEQERITIQTVIDLQFMMQLQRQQLILYMFNNSDSDSYVNKLIWRVGGI